MAHVPSKVLREWCFDDPAGELCQLRVLDDQTVLSTYGRHAHSSGSKECSWSDFISGRLDELVLKKLGAKVLTEAREFVARALGE